MLTLAATLNACIANPACDKTTAGRVDVTTEDSLSLRNVYFIPHNFQDDPNLYRLRTCQGIDRLENGPWFQDQGPLFTFTRLEPAEEIPCEYTNGDQGYETLECNPEQVRQLIEDPQETDIIAIITNRQDVVENSHLEGILTFSQHALHKSFYLAAHEFAHAHANLADEYSVQQGGGQTERENCAQSFEDCEQRWAAYEGRDCQQGCDRQESLWRFSNDCIMHDISYNYGGPTEFCAVCEDLLDEATQQLIDEQ